MVGDRQVSDRRTVLQAIGAIAGLGATGLVSADRDRSRLRSDGPLGSVSIDSAAEAVSGENGEWAYVATNTGFVTVDISDASNPTVEASREVSDISGILDLDIEESTDRLTVPGPANPGGLGIEHPDDPSEPSASSGFGLYDISDPSDPEELAIFSTDYTIHNCYHQGDVVYLVNNSTAEMVMVDVADDDPTEIGRWGLSGATTLHDLFVQDGVAYLAYWNSGTAMVDVSDPANPSLIGLVREGSSKNPNNDHYVMPSEDGNLVAIGKEQIGFFGNLGVELWDISDKTNTEFLAEIDPPESPEFGERTSHNFDFSGDHLYTSWYAGGVRVHDISSPSSPDEVASYREDGPEFWTAKVAEEGEFYVASDYSGGGLYTFSDPQGSSPPDPEPELDVSTGAATGVGENAATLNGTLSGLGDADSADVWFEWGPAGSGLPNQTDTETLSSTGSFSADLSGLEAGTAYEFEAYADSALDDDAGGTNSFETDDGFDFCFITTATADDTETLDSLRRFRDESMRATPVGKGLVGLYYRISPPIARTLHRHPDSTEAELTRAIVDTCASLSDTQAETDSAVRSGAIGVVLTMLYFVGLLVGAGSHASLRARETLGQ